MQWPEKPTCHKINPVFTLASDHKWRDPMPLENRSEIDPGTHISYHARTCNHCGSIHPEDLLAFLNDNLDGVKLEVADWKYGWPHKFYVKVPSTMDGKPVNLRGKWYNEHFQDDGMDDEALNALAEHIKRQTGIQFGRNEKGVWYKSPL